MRRMMVGVGVVIMLTASGCAMRNRSKGAADQARPSAPAKGTKIVTVSDNHVDLSRADLKNGAQDLLSDVVRTMKQSPDLHISVEGHADSKGSSDANQRLSERRANVVKTYLSGQGIDPNRITARGLGESRPIASNKTPQGRQQNRRVEIVVE